ncbi:fasciculation and elongation protein zeta-1 isoform X1 [Nerophis ophidion]|uniref:fasciculation and elongation protein zeta-1 isoform X1 n=1 Tax=Nerophis ophidion TaxID=159077 RepID=UPI002ADFC5CD|nr:fasciculation and elongation protein zeta-1 isoform X1 [Nerophis ophidion]XP_061754036.1 fasciculation and elongation protein zeta-1 isoform X1 [Nerophis ophidion]XP_061754037.1 fasciculation and elongation protein zeta-1 isoform X1 [Nerophis ophidion]
MEAPLVCLDEEFEDLRPCRMDDLEHPALKYPSYTTPATSVPLASITREDFSELENFSEMMSFKSMEDLVNEFDEKLNVCFHNYNTKTEGLAPIRNQSQSQEEEEQLQDEDVWDALTDNYITGWDGPVSEGLNGNLSDQETHEKEEEEMNEKNDNANCLKDDPLITADQVIEEIAEMMENSPDPGETEEEDDDDESSASRTQPSLLEEIRQLSQASNNNCSYEGLSLMPGSALLELLQRVEATICEYSEELISQLARRDELEFEKEVKNTFITTLLEVQNRQKEQRDSSKRRRRDKALSLQGGGSVVSVNVANTGTTGRTDKTGSMPVKRFSMEGLSNILQTGIRQTFGSTGNEKQYLNTVIPYEKKGSPPSVDDLQMLTKILFAIKEDSEKVPTLLTDYILKVLCPT